MTGKQDEIEAKERVLAETDETVKKLMEQLKTLQTVEVVCTLL